MKVFGVSTKNTMLTKFKDNWAVVVAQLAEWSLPTPEIRGSNPDISNKNFKSVNCYPEKSKIKKKRPGMAQFNKKFKDNFSQFCRSLKKAHYVNVVPTEDVPRLIGTRHIGRKSHSPKNL